MDMYTLDASVVLNAFNETEIGYTESNQLITQLVTQTIPIIEPSLVLVEVAATISRIHGDTILAQDFAIALQKLPQITFIPLDHEITQQALEVAANYQLRGADAVYVAVALRYNTSLISLDQEHLTRVTSIIPTLTPAQALANI
ncbi:type II toxin-antitoxin system VapC family toxin [Candidatus Parabeggiatoa sp. HSG14]|uniref:type II toxin-antitoxin system VapC family toxin n=1 Tax=Candidatus Parabeggiatoa sp. HSG14 TaxID=3055593 RepID=UPI0025A91911|nr:type II toxin-antitoxin system VapC family toxin [Thiotrichales bacterium HSG14]